MRFKRCLVGILAGLNFIIFNFLYIFNHFNIVMLKINFKKIKKYIILI